MMLTDMLLQHQYDAYYQPTSSSSSSSSAAAAVAVTRVDLQLVEEEYYYNRCLVLRNQQELLSLEQQRREQLEEQIQYQEDEYKRRLLQTLQQSSSYEQTNTSSKSKRTIDVVMNLDIVMNSSTDGDNDSGSNSDSSSSLDDGEIDNDNDNDSNVSMKSQSKVVNTKKYNETTNDRPKKRVRFSNNDAESNINDNTSVNHHQQQQQTQQQQQDSIIIIPGRQQYIEDNLIEQLWWDEKTIHINRLEQKRLADVHNKRNDPNYYDSILFLTKTFPSEEENDSEEVCSENNRCSNNNSNTNNKNDIHDLRRTLVKHLNTIIQADVRGLEQRSISALRVQRRLASQSILNLQQQIRQTNRTFVKQYSLVQNANTFDSESTTPTPTTTTIPISYDKMTKLLRRRSVQASRRSRQLAFRLAQADRLIASKIHSA